jgi:hypothetical protein
MYKLIFMFLLFSCADVKESKEERAELKNRASNPVFVNKDSDYDGYEDSLDPNPTVSDFPKIDIFRINSFSVGFKYLNDDSLTNFEIKYDKRDFDILKEKRFSLIQKRLAKLHYNRSILNVYSYNQEDLVDNQDFNIFFVSSYKPQKFYKISSLINDDTGKIAEDSGIVGTSFQLHIKNLNHVTEISEIVVGIYSLNNVDQSLTEVGKTILRDSSFTMVKIPTTPGQDWLGDNTYELLFTQLPLSLITESLGEFNDLVLRVDNFKYKRNGRLFTYSRQVDLAKNNLTNFVYGDIENQRQSFVHKSHSLKSISNLFNLGFQFQDELIRSNKRYTNTLLYPFNIQQPRPNQLKGGSWEYVGSENAKNTFSGSKNIFVSYSTGADIRNSQSTVENIETGIFKSGDSLRIRNVTPNEIYIITFRGRVFKTSTKVRDRNIPCLVVVPVPDDRTWGSIERSDTAAKTCRIRERIKDKTRSSQIDFNDFNPDLIEIDGEPNIYESENFGTLNSGEEFKFVIKTKPGNEDFPKTIDIKFKKYPDATRTKVGGFMKELYFPNRVDLYKNYKAEPIILDDLVVDEYEVVVTKLGFNK